MACFHVHGYHRKGGHVKGYKRCTRSHRTSHRRRRRRR